MTHLHICPCTECADRILRRLVALRNFAHESADDHALAPAHRDLSRALVRIAEGLVLGPADHGPHTPATRARGFAELELGIAAAHVLLRDGLTPEENAELDGMAKGFLDATLLDFQAKGTRPERLAVRGTGATIKASGEDAMAKLRAAEGVDCPPLTTAPRTSGGPS